MGSDDKKKKKMVRKSEDGSKKRGKRREEGGEEEPRMITDDRFASAQSDPRFMEAPKKRSKVAIDSRFSHLFTDRSFTSSAAPIDKRGKTKDKNNKAAASLKHYYRIVGQEDENGKTPIEEEDEGDSDSKSGRLGSQTESESDELGNTLDDDGQSFDESSSTGTSDSDDEYVDEDDLDILVQMEDVPEIEAETKRLAVVSMDWSQVRAVDLYALLNSFLHKGGQIKSVAIYPSEFGLKRMKEEAVRGPVGLFDDEEGDEDGEDDEIDDKRLRAYEISRLRYYYAVVECDSSATADYLYRTCDGMEFQRSANRLDLRFIPDSMDFKHQPRDIATEVPADYDGVDFETRALQQSKVQLTWDEDEPQRTKTLNRKFTDDQLAEMELKGYLASDVSETDDEKEDDKDDDEDVDDTADGSLKKSQVRDMYRSLILSGDASDEDHEEGNGQDMEVTFNSGLEEISKRILEKKDGKSETVWEEYLRKRREKRKLKNGSKYSSEDESSDTDQELADQPDDFFVEEPSEMGSKDNPVQSKKKRKSNDESGQEAEASRAELELLLADDKGTDSKLKGYNLKPNKKSKGKKGKEIPDVGNIPTVNYDDPRFSALFTSPEFAVDPTDPQFKRSAAYARQIASKQKGNHESQGQNDGTNNHSQASMGKDGKVTSDGDPERREKSELSSLIKSLKMKSKQLTLPSRGKVLQKHKSTKERQKGK